MGHGNSVSIDHPQSYKFYQILSSCWRWPWKREHSSVLTRPAASGSSYSAPINKRLRHKRSTIFHPQYSEKQPMYGRDVRARVNDPRDRKARIETPQCEVGYCYRRRLPGTTYCKSHICRTTQCAEVRAIGSLHCAAHKCRSCNIKAKTRNSYCEAHQCRIPSCLRGKKSGQDWCRRHVCRWDDDCGGAPVKGARYCDYHACAAEGCVFKVLLAGDWVGDYCCCHTCSAEGCLRGAASTGSFCADHKCLIHGCPNPRLWDGHEEEEEEEGGCCRFHTCVQRGCFAPTARVGALCELHARLCYGRQSPRVCYATGQELRRCAGDHHRRRHRRRQNLRAGNRGEDLVRGDVERWDSLDHETLPVGALCSVM